MKTAVIYARYSSERQTEQSIDGQLRVCKEYAERNDIAIVDTYIDRAMSGTNDNRVAFQKMLKDSNKKAWDIVLVYKLDRFSRDKYETAIHRRHLRNNGAKLVSAMENIPDTPEGIILESLLEGMNQYYSAELSQKVKRGMKESRAKGNFTGGYTLYGYKVVDKKVVIDEEQAEIVRYIFGEFAGGRLVTDIMAELQEKGIRHKGKCFARNIIYRMLDNEKYSGIYRHKDEVFDNIYPRIIEQSLFDRVRVKLDNNKYGKHKPDVCYYLKNKVVCGYCGHSINSDSGTSKNGTIMRYYKCSGRRKGVTCSCKPIRKEVLEDIVVKSLVNNMTDDVINDMADKMLEMQKEKLDNNIMLNMLSKECNEVEKSISNILSAIEKGIITNSTKQRLEELETRKSQLSTSIAIEKSKERLELTREDIFKYIKPAMQQAPQLMIDSLVKQVTVYNDKIVIQLKSPDTDRPDDNNRQVFSFYTTYMTVVTDSKKFGKSAIKIRYEIVISI